MKVGKERSCALLQTAGRSHCVIPTASPPADDDSDPSSHEPSGDSKETGSSVLHHEELNSAENLNEQEHSFFPRTYRKEHNSANTLILAQ